MWKEFREFAVKGNVVDLAVGVIIGGAFGKIVSSIVSDIVMPPFALLLGKVNFTNRFITLSGKHYSSLAAAQSGGAVTINYGLFINNVIEFLIVAFVLFIVVKQINRLRRQQVPKEPSEKDCPYCISRISIKATRCPNCTSNLSSK